MGFEPMKKYKFHGAILFEVALAMILNLTFLLGGLEFGWYFYSRQALVGAARQAARTEFQRTSEQTVQTYLIGLNFSDDFIDAVVVDSSDITLNKATVHRVTVSAPLSNILLFGGTPSGMNPSSEATTLSVTAYERENDLKKKKNDDDDD